MDVYLKIISRGHCQAFAGIYIGNRIAETEKQEKKRRKIH